jgi:membrane associated rhomboid family serine protease
MFPLRDDNPALESSVATLSIIALNLVAWAWLQKLGSEPGLSLSVCTLGVIPGELLGTAMPGTQVPMGAASCVLGPEPNWLTPISSMFMHGGWFHILGNMWFLYIFGDNVEDSMGGLRFVVFYLLCGLAAVAAQVYSDTSSTIPMVGASGAIGGVMGAYAFLYPKAPVHMMLVFGFFLHRIVVPAYMMLGYWVLVQVLGGAMDTDGGGGTAFWAHVGGFAAGVALVPLFRVERRVAHHREHLAEARSHRWG